MDGLAWPQLFFGINGDEINNGILMGKILEYHINGILMGYIIVNQWDINGENSWEEWG